MSKEEAIKTLQTRSCYECSYGCDSADSCENEDCYLREATLMAIEALEERKMGKWIDIPFKRNARIGECDNCGYRVELDDGGIYQYCSSCGAKLEE